MYCGCNPIALTSQAQISDALIRLMNLKPYSSITVSELCRESGVSRPTFYSLFNSMENVVVFTLQAKACRLPHVSDSVSTLEQLCGCYSRYICDNRELLKTLVENKVGYLLYDSIYDSLLCCQEHGNASPQMERQYAAHFLAGALTGVVRQYCSAEPPASVDILHQILYDLLNGNFFRDHTGWDDCVPSGMAKSRYSEIKAGSIK